MSRDHHFQGTITDLPAPDKGKAGDPWKKVWRFYKNFFSRSQGLLPFKNDGQTQRKTIKFIEHKRKSHLGTKK